MNNRMKEARFFAGKSQPKVALETGIYYSTISRMECGYITPSDDQKKKIAKSLNVDQEWLFPASGEVPTTDRGITLNYKVWTAGAAFVAHVQSHLKPGEKVICKICGKNIEQICEE